LSSSSDEVEDAWKKNGEKVAAKIWEKWGVVLEGKDDESENEPKKDKGKKISTQSNTDSKKLSKNKSSSIKSDNTVAKEKEQALWEYE